MSIIARKNTAGLVLYTVSNKPIDVFETFTFWPQLSKEQQEQLQAETSSLLAAQTQLGLSTIEIGQRLIAIRTLLSPHRGAFMQLLKASHFSERTGRRYMQDYKRLRKYVTQPVLDVMKEHGFRLWGTRGRPLGDYTEAYMALVSANELPPAEPATALDYVTKLELQHERLKTDPKALLLVKAHAEKTGSARIYAIRNNEDFLQKQAHHLLKSSLRRLPPNRRDAFLEMHIGYALTLRGVSSKRFDAQAVPAHYNRPQGRPSDEEMEGQA